MGWVGGCLPGTAGGGEALGNAVSDGLLGDLCLGFQLQGCKDVVGQPCLGFWAQVQVPGAAVWVAVVKNWLNWSSCLLLLAGPGLTMVTLPWHGWGWSEQNLLQIWKWPGLKQAVPVTSVPLRVLAPKGSCSDIPSTRAGHCSGGLAAGRASLPSQQALGCGRNLFWAGCGGGRAAGLAQPVPPALSSALPVAFPCHPRFLRLGWCQTPWGSPGGRASPAPLASEGAALCTGSVQDEQAGSASSPPTTSA